MEEKSFGALIKNLRLKSGMGSREISRLINKGSSYISQVENGRNKKPDYRIAYTLLKILGVDEKTIDSILEQYDISPPKDNSHIIDFEKEFEKFREDYNNLIPRTIDFTKSINETDKAELLKKINTIREMMILIIDFEPDRKKTINKYYQLFFSYAHEVVSKRLKEIIEDADLKTMTTIGDQLKDELNKRGLSELLNEEVKF